MTEKVVRRIGWALAGLAAAAVGVWALVADHDPPIVCGGGTEPVATYENGTFECPPGSPPPPVDPEDLGPDTGLP